MPREIKGIRVLQREWLPYAPMHPFKPTTFASNERGTWVGGLHEQGDRYSRAWYRAQADGRVSVAMADELCINVLRKHPAEVFGPLWFASHDTRTLWSTFCQREGLGL